MCSISLISTPKTADLATAFAGCSYSFDAAFAIDLKGVIAEGIDRSMVFASDRFVRSLSYGGDPTRTMSRSGELERMGRDSILPQIRSKNRGVPPKAKQKPKQL